MKKTSIILIRIENHPYIRSLDEFGWIVFDNFEFSIDSFVLWQNCCFRQEIVCFETVEISPDFDLLRNAQLCKRIRTKCNQMRWIFYFVLFCFSFVFWIENKAQRKQ